MPFLGSAAAGGGGPGGASPPHRATADALGFLAPRLTRRHGGNSAPRLPRRGVGSGPRPTLAAGEAYNFPSNPCLMNVLLVHRAKKACLCGGSAFRSRGTCCCKATGGGSAQMTISQSGGSSTRKKLLGVALGAKASSKMLVEYLTAGLVEINDQPQAQLEFINSSRKAPKHASQPNLSLHAPGVHLKLGIAPSSRSASTRCRRQQQSPLHTTACSELKKSLNAVFSQFGKILDVLAFKTLKHKGQAWVVFEDVASATEAIKRMQDFPFYDKPMRIQYAKTKSDIVAKADGTFVPRERRKRIDEKPEKKQKREQHHDASQIGMGVNAYPGVYGAPQLTQIPIAGGQRVMMPEIIVPNNILFVQNLPHETTPMMLQMLFCQYPGFKEVRMVEAKPGIAFVEYGDEAQATAAMTPLQGFKITKENQMVITYAKK